MTKIPIKAKKIVFVLVGIILLVSVIYGVIYLFKNLTEIPCDQGQTRYSNLNNLCGPICSDDIPAKKYTDSNGNEMIGCCDGVIVPGSNGICRSKDYCDNSTDNQKYHLHSDGLCYLDCSGITGSTQIPSKGTTMTKDKNNKNKPLIPLSCGFPCKYAPGSICKDDQIFGGPSDEYICGKELSKNGESNKGCFNPDKYVLCNKETDLVCRKRLDGGNYCDSDNKYCLIDQCTGYYPCRNDADCTYDQDDGVTCSLNESTLLKKGITGIGLCKKNKIYTTGDILFDANLCTDDKNLISQTNSEDPRAVCKPDKQFGPVNLQLGLNEKLQDTCYDSYNNNNHCTIHGFCDNNWQAKLDENGTTCLPGGSVPTDPKILCCTRFGYNGLTCDDGKCKYGVCMKDNKCYSCCDAKADIKDGICVNITENPYNHWMLGAPAAKSGPGTDCKTDNDCTKYNDKFKENLGMKDLPIDPNDRNYSRLFCDKDKGKCKAICGTLDAGQTEEGDIVVENDKDSSYCFKRNDCKLVDTEVFLYNDNENNNRICCTNPKDNSSTKCDPNDLAWSRYNNNGTFDDNNEYISYSTQKYKCKDNNVTIGSGACAKKAANNKGIYNSHDDGQGTCHFWYDCLDVTSNTTNNEGNNIEWKDLSDPSKNNNNNDDGWNTKIAGKGDPNSTCGSGCKTSSKFPSKKVQTVFDTDNCQNYAHAAYCSYKKTDKNTKLLENGRYCKKGVDTVLNKCF